MVTMAEPVVSFYLIHTNAGRSDCPQAKSDTLNRVSLDGTSLKNDAESRSWRVTFDRSSTTQTLTCLVVFGSHPKCTIVLNGSNISPVHCIIYAQLNSGHKMMVIEDRSESGTSFFDGSSARAGIQIRILQDRLYAEDLRTIDVGSYQFRIEIPVLEAEKMELGRWFFEHEPQPASEPMLRAQLKGKRPEFQDLGQVGQGGNGKIYRFVEKRTGLLFAVKKQPEYLNNNAQRESMWMKTLQSPLLAQYIYSRPVEKDSVLEWWTYMPLYRGNLTTMLPQPLEILDRIMLQMLEAVSFVHGKGALHQDIKPDNFFLLRKRPVEVVLGDFGHTVSTQDHGLLVGDCGTEGFAAPERLSQCHTTALDIYSLGVSFFLMLEFERLRHPEWKKCMANIAQQPPRVYGGLIKRMVATDPKDRPSIQECMAAVRARHYDWGKPAQILRQPVQQLPAQVSPIVTANCVKKRLDQPGKNVIHHKIRHDPVTDVRMRPSVPAADAAPINTSMFKRSLGQPAKTTTGHKIFAKHDTTSETTPSVLVANVREHEGNATTHHNIFAHLNSKIRPAPTVAAVARREHKDNVLRPQAKHSQNSKRIARPEPYERRCVGTRDQIRRGPIRKANIKRAFAMGQRVTRICDTTTNMGKCLWYLGKGIVTTTCDIALLGVDAFKLCKDVGRARHVIKHMEPQASIQLGDATRLAAGMKSKKLSFVTPVEYELERMESAQVERLETVSEDEPAQTTDRYETARNIGNGVRG